MENYDLNQIKIRNPWLPLIFAVIAYPFIILMTFVGAFAMQILPGLGIFVSLLAIIGGICFSLYPLDRIYRINLDLLKIDSKAPSKNSWVSAVILSILIIGIPYFIYLLFKFSSSLERVSSKEISAGVTFLLLFLFFPLGVTYSQYKLNNLSREESTSEPGISENELTAKKYIEDYKSQYPKESIKTALINSGISENEVENYLNKYF